MGALHPLWALFIWGPHADFHPHNSLFYFPSQFPYSITILCSSSLCELVFLSSQ